MSSLDTFFNEKDVVAEERRTRIRLSLYAYAYEFENDSLISDEEYDRLSRSVNTSISTGHSILDKFFREHFEPDTGMWICKHPELWKVRGIYEYYYKDRNNATST